MLSTGPQGTLAPLSSVNASHFVLVIVHCSIMSKTSCSLGRRASGVS